VEKNRDSGYINSGRKEETSGFSYNLESVREGVEGY
jgi:hypothetical protein